MKGQKIKQIRCDVWAGPIVEGADFCPLAVDGNVTVLNEEQRRHLAGYLIAGLTIHCPDGLLVDQILTTADGSKAGVRGE